MYTLAVESGNGFDLDISLFERLVRRAPPHNFPKVAHSWSEPRIGCKFFYSLHRSPLVRNRVSKLPLSASRETPETSTRTILTSQQSPPQCPRVQVILAKIKKTWTVLGRQVTLEMQRRMRPEIAELIRPIYPRLLDHPSTAYPDVKGVRSDIYEVMYCRNCRRSGISAGCLEIVV